MHVKAKKIAFGGLALAVTLSCMMLGGVIETNTLFFLAGASFLEGIMIRETGMRTGTAYLLAAVILGMFIVPNKFYVLSYGCMALYILLIEGAWLIMGRFPIKYQKRAVFWGVKYLIFNIIYFPVLIFGSKFLFDFSFSLPVKEIMLAAGQIGLLLYDKAYEYIQAQIWPRLRKQIFR